MEYQNEKIKQAVSNGQKVLRRVNIKIRIAGNADALWESLPVIATMWENELQTVIWFVKQAYGRDCEIRWNYEGSLQGHYITTGMYAAREL